MRSLKAGDDVFAQWCNWLPFVRNAQSAKEIFQIRRDSMFEKLRTLQVAPHWIDAGNGDQVLEETRGFGHGDW